MRQKAENEMRDRYARRYAAVLAVEALIRFRGKGEDIAIIIEAEDDPHWDDILEIDKKTGKLRRRQVKRQQTPLTEAVFKTYIKSAAAGAADVEYHFALPVLVYVRDAGDLHVLRGLCVRVQQAGAVEKNVLENLRDAERVWVDCLASWTGLNETDIFGLLRRLHIDIIGYEDDLDRLALRLLEPIFGHSTEAAWAKIREFVSDKDGVVEIRPRQLWDILPPPASDEVDTFYWSFVEEVETQFILDHWQVLTDNLVRDIIPIEFHDGVLQFVHSVQGAAWPRRYPELDAAFEKLADQTHDYIAFFNTRSDNDGSRVRENRDYKRVFPNPNYWQEVQAAKAWDRGVQKRLHNMVVALNKLFASVRTCLKPTYRLREGRLGITDSMGHRSQLEPMVYYPKEYIDLTKDD